MKKTTINRTALAKIISGVITLVAFCGFLWLFSVLLLPRLGFSPSLLGTILLTCVPTAIVGAIASWICSEYIDDEYSDVVDHPANWVVWGLAALCVVCLLIGAIVSWTWFHVDQARARIEPITVENAEFVEKLPSFDSATAYAWADSDTARKLAARKTGELHENASLFTSTENLSTVLDKDGAIVKYIPLDYKSLFAYNKGLAVPGYIVVDPVTQEATYVAKEYVYSPGAFFGRDMMRCFWRHNRTASYGDVLFQVAPDGTPCWVAEIERVDTWFVKTVVGISVMDATTGEITDYDLADAPEWTTNINGLTAMEYYNAWGKYINGYWNFSNIGETMTTDDFGYVAIDGIMYYYTGITSVTMQGDESNLGVLLYNSKTGEAMYTQTAGAEEYSAMAAAQGVVQNYGYEASFPSLCNVNGELTYVMALKDANGIVKQYGMVNYSNYTIAVTAPTLTEAAKAYAKAMGGEAIVTDPTGELTELTITVQDVKFITVDGNTVTYIQSADGEWFKKAFTENDLFVKIGDEMTILTDNEGLVHVIVIQ